MSISTSNIRRAAGDVLLRLAVKDFAGVIMAHLLEEHRALQVDQPQFLNWMLIRTRGDVHFDAGQMLRRLIENVLPHMPEFATNKFTEALRPDAKRALQTVQG